MIPNHTTWQQVAEQMKQLLKLGRRPIAVTFLDAVPRDIPPFSDTVRFHFLRLSRSSLSVRIGMCAGHKPRWAGHRSTW